MRRNIHLKGIIVRIQEKTDELPSTYLAYGKLSTKVNMTSPAKPHGLQDAVKTPLSCQEKARLMKGREQVLRARQFLGQENGGYMIPGT